MRAASIGILLLAVAACAPKPPLLSLAGRACDTAPRFTSAVAVPFGRESGASVFLDETSPCLARPPGAANSAPLASANYAVFALPAGPLPYRLTLGSLPTAPGMVWPVAGVYDYKGQLLRVVTGFQARAYQIVTATQAGPGDRYVVLASDPATIAQPRSIPTASAAAPIRLAAAVFIPIILPPQPVGPLEGATVVTLAHNGTVFVAATPNVTVR